MRSPLRYGSGSGRGRGGGGGSLQLYFISHNSATCTHGRPTPYLPESPRPSLFFPRSKLTKDRFLIEWEAEIVPAIKSGKRVLIVAHGNTIRGLCQHLDEISDDEITGLDIPTGNLTDNFCLDR